MTRDCHVAAVAFNHRSDDWVAVNSWLAQQCLVGPPIIASRISVASTASCEPGKAGSVDSHSLNNRTCNTA